MKKFLPSLGKLLVAAIFVIACWMLYHKIRSYSLEEILDSILHIRSSQLLAAVLLVVLNYIVLVGYDWLAVRAIHRRLPLPRVALVSFTGCAVSYNLGALLGGTTVRYRLYSAWGFHPLDIVRLVLMLAVTFWIGALGLAGGVLLFANVHIPPELGIDPAHIRPLGGFLVALCVLYLALCSWARERPIMLFKKEFALPSLHLALAQTCVACADLLVAAACLYVLLPVHASLTFADFLPNYLFAQVAVVLTHVPGGVGVLEAILMHIVHGVDPRRLFGAILVFRVLYYLVPLLFSTVILFFYEFRLRNRSPEQIEQEKKATLLPGGKA
ncbi:YbhN family protein [uncultured Mailhella sp.]|uniref:lysylphosphatidylglycerol synthase transmembrane domain-containing protein n=1 Tax=uncultured Mailhella sp. TaxID=1981031 RepID=UPI00262E6B83|nr:YbhN family protein [uncultured Mailhella sp.]